MIRVSLESIAREVGRECSLEAQLALSLLVGRVKLAAAESEREQVEVIDFERGWVLIEEA